MDFCRHGKKSDCFKLAVTTFDVKLDMTVKT